MSYANVMLYSAVIPSYDYDKDKDTKKAPQKSEKRTNYGDFLKGIKQFTQ
ncbi:TPA: hypothetical protein WM899_001244 [Neisseria gonorrhoeae]|jgi:hypothetical protein|nr:hypothetical protein [Capnocytophaga sputigena]DAF19823.1 MAG TPA: hypothetical protein [Caudoviricetes sp.]DAU48749.1 MAG TPA: hypothetical protein [Caudoviricetes sp.]DAW43096.1 MAG TPA: hypothetical protein [Caudoviricetes sp.]